MMKAMSSQSARRTPALLAKGILPLVIVACGGTTFQSTVDGGTDGGGNGTGDTGETSGTAGTGGTGETSGTAGTGASAGTGGSAGTAGSAGTGGTGAGTGGTGGTGAGTGGTGGACGGSHSSPIGRPSPVACPAHSSPIVSNGESDGGGPSCTSLAACTDDGSANFFYVSCLRGKCSVDACLTDSDCKGGQVCACADEIGGGGALRLGNECMTTQCQVDSDCGSGQVCSASVGPCGSLLGFYCHTPADECLTNSDCCGTTPLCTFQTTSGHWACQGAAVACSG